MRVRTKTRATSPTCRARSMTDLPAGHGKAGRDRTVVAVPVTGHVSVAACTTAHRMVHPVRCPPRPSRRDRRVRRPPEARTGETVGPRQEDRSRRSAPPPPSRDRRGEDGTPEPSRRRRPTASGSHRKGTRPKPAMSSAGRPHLRWARPSGSRSTRSTSAPTSPRCRGSSPTPRRCGSRSLITVVGTRIVGRGASDTIRAAITCLMYQYFVRAAGHRRRVHRRLPGAASQLAARPDRRPRRRPSSNALLVTFVPLAIFATAPDPAQTQRVHRHRVPALADLRRPVRLGRRVVPPVPAAVEPEPRQARRGQEEGERRQVANRPARTRRPAPAAGRSRSRASRAEVAAQSDVRRGARAARPAHSRVSRVRRARLRGPRPEPARPVPPPRGVAGSRGRSR